MLRSMRVRFVGLVLLAIVSLGVFWVGPFTSLFTAGKPLQAQMLSTILIPIHTLEKIHQHCGTHPLAI